MSSLFNTIKKYYDKGIYDKDDLALFLSKGKITEEEYLEIIGDSE